MSVLKYFDPTTNEWVNCNTGRKVDTELDTASSNPIANRIVTAALDQKADSSHTHTKSQITDFPTALPASDVSAWAKEPEKPTYTAEEIGAAASSHTHTTANITNFPTSMTPTAHNQAASTITAGTLAGQVVANAAANATVGTMQVRNTALVSADTNPSSNGTINWTYA